MLEVQEAGDETRSQDWPPRTKLKWLGGDAVNGCPVDHVGQLDQWVMQVDMVSQRKRDATLSITHKFCPDIEAELDVM
jgi:hypothetical protein